MVLAEECDASGGRVMKDLKALTQMLGIVMKHDPVTMARVSAVYERRTKPRKRIALVPTRRSK